MKELKESELQSGDILIYENQNFSWTRLYEEMDKDYQGKGDSHAHTAFYMLLYMIPWFDPGKTPKDYKNYYHAAVWGTIRGEKDNSLTTGVVGMGRSGIGIGGQISTGGVTVKSIRVYRNNRLDFDPYKINDGLQYYYDQNKKKHIPYAYESAYFLAVLCSIRYKDGTLRSLIERQLGKGSIWVDFFYKLAIYIVNDYMSRHQEEMMVCSTLVSLAFKKAGFQLRVNDFESGKNKEQIAALDVHDKVPMEFQELLSAFPKASDFPDIEIPETLVTPRQLFESPDVSLLGYFGDIS